MAPTRHEWDAPLAHLRSLPFIRELDFDAEGKTIDLTTPRGRHRMSVEVKRSYLDRTLVNAILSHAPERSAGGKISLLRTHHGRFAPGTRALLQPQRPKFGEEEEEDFFEGE